ncbi:myophilin-like isoform X2 [Symsagittifera roscoffensis]|uniref:myophilin-like isoform X2 n=1 Tax=Symsagittifera roscoffensis TaxID=84072 RepID=UPI00307BCE72
MELSMEVVAYERDFKTVFMDGIILCKLIAALPDGKVGKYNKKAAGKFQMMENADAFVKAMKAYGVSDDDSFASVDLVEARGINQVKIALLSLARKAQVKEGYNGPTLGVKEATENKREFTEEQLNEAKNIPRAW